MKWWRENKWFVFLLLISTVAAFWPFFIKGQVPFPGDILLGNYHPWKDVVWSNMVAGYPVKNVELSDVLTQYYPFKREVIRQLKEGHLPEINPYIFSGTPLLADGHSGTLYPLNLIFWLINDFNYAWSVFIIIQPILGSFLFYGFLRSTKLNKLSATWGAMVFGFNSYFLNQVEFGTVMHTIVWLPLSLWAINKWQENKWLGGGMLILSWLMSFMAGFMQLFVYHILLTAAYYWWQIKDKKRTIVPLILCLSIFVIISLPQSVPWLKLLPQTSRWQGIGLDEEVTEYLIKPKLLLTAIVPDLFGSPVRMNWFGSQYNYYEFVFYCGGGTVLLMFFISLKDRGNRFFLTVLLVSLAISVDTPVSRLIYSLKLPVVSSLNPARNLAMTVTALAFLSSQGLANIVKEKYSRKKLWWWVVIVSGLIFTYLAFGLAENWQRLVAVRNLIVPGITTGIAWVTLWVYQKFKKNKLIWVLITVNTIGLVYQGQKFNTFTATEYIFPKTETIKFLEDNLSKDQKMLSIHQEVLPVNVNMIYGFKTPNGYHPVHLADYNRQIAQWQFPLKTNPSFGRTVFLTDVRRENLKKTGVRYALTIEKVSLPYLREVFTEGKTIVYEYVPTTVEQEWESPEGL